MNKPFHMQLFPEIWDSDLNPENFMSYFASASSKSIGPKEAKEHYQNQFNALLYTFTRNGAKAFAFLSRQLNHAIRCFNNEEKNVFPENEEKFVADIKYNLQKNRHWGQSNINSLTDNEWHIYKTARFLQECTFTADYTQKVQKQTEALLKIFLNTSDPYIDKDNEQILKETIAYKSCFQYFATKCIATKALLEISHAFEADGLDVKKAMKELGYYECFARHVNEISQHTQNYKKNGMDCIGVVPFEKAFNDSIADLMKSCEALLTINSFPKIYKINRDALDLFDNTNAIIESWEANRYGSEAEWQEHGYALRNKKDLLELEREKRVAKAQQELFSCKSSLAINMINNSDVMK